MYSIMIISQKTEQQKCSVMQQIWGGRESRKADNLGI